MCHFKYFILFLMLGLCYNVEAQDRPTSPDVEKSDIKNDANGKNENFKILTNSKLSKDSLRFSCYRPGERAHKFSFSDTLIGRSFLEFRPTWHGDKYYGDLGNLGSATYPLTQPDVDAQLGAQTGVNLFKPYTLTKDDLIFMDLKVPFTQGEFHQGNELKQSYFKGFLAARLTPALDVSFRYNNINQEGFYLSQTNHNKNMLLGFDVHSLKRYKAYFVLATNKVEQQNNGGITADSLLNNGTFGTEISVPIRLNEKTAYTYFDDKNFNGQQNFDFIKGQNNSIALIHDFNWSQVSFKSYDTNPDSLFYSTLDSFETDLRHFIKIDRIDNNLGLQWQNKKITLSGQVMYQYAKIINEPRSSSVHFLGLKSKLQWQIDEDIKLKGLFKQLNSKLGNELYLGGDIHIDLGKHVMNAYYKLKSSIIDQNKSFLSISNKEQYDNDFNNVTINTVGGSYAFKPWGVLVKGKFDLMSQYIYMDTFFQFKQLSKTINVAHISLEKNFKWKSLHSDNKLLLQSTNFKALPLPRLIYLNDFYYEGLIFKNKMHFKAGASLKYISQKSLPRYNNIGGVFTLSETQEAAYPWLDLFLALKVNTFRFYFIYSNITPLLQPNTHYHFVENFPVFESKFRVGVNWQFRN